RDIAGRVYHSASTGGAWLVTVDTGRLPKGIYFVRLSSPAGIVTKKFIRN
ncbi:MAG: T9SS type A sorting domain-containing protein, partial [Bacteroidetes bacterium]|nr:T9SS type A sorting domain-containing protein [Bacteroidota bacterium]